MVDHRALDYKGCCTRTYHDHEKDVTHWCYMPEGHSWVHVCGVCNLWWAVH